ncbi:hypothetical protein [Levilactobacillus fujinensis]|uniref:ASCH domain-containing protein n=1 Tax=Levilactobacillus fujinensis TaxID=2486024 RepID=A0ABW1TK59_9LACO|nr:hypothetical protein [Levilactobacillus fujinensis]
MTLIQAHYNPLLPTLLMSLHPQPTAAILSGRKIIEYRRRFFQHPFQAFVYTTGSTGALQLFLSFGQPISRPTTTLIQIDTRLQTDATTNLTTYLADQGVALPIKSVATLPHLSREQLRQIDPKFIPPRAYFFLDKPDKQDLLTHLLQQPCLSYRKIDWKSKYAAIQEFL